MQSVVALLCEGALYCPDHCEYDSEDLQQGHVSVVTEFDMMIGEGLAELISGECCCCCGEEF